MRKIDQNKREELNMKILLTGAFSYSSEQLEEIRRLGFEIDFLQQEKDVPAQCGQYECVVCNGLFLHHNIEKFEKLKFVQLTSAGYDRIPMDYAEKNKIQVHNAAGVYNIPIAEFTVLKILEFYKKTRFFYENQKQHTWEKERNIIELAGKTATIIGFGNIGKEIAKRLSSFDVQIIGVDIRNPGCGLYEYVHINDLDPSLKKSDIVILTLPLDKKNEGFFDESKFSSMKPEALLVNMARGKLVVTDDLIYALKSKKISGAILDVFEEEPLGEDSELWDMENVILTPHNSFVGENNPKRLFSVIYKNLVQYKKMQGGEISLKPNVF